MAISAPEYRPRLVTGSSHRQKRAPARSYLATLCAAVLAVVALASPLRAQPAAFEGRPVAQVRIDGLSRVDEQFVRNQLRARAGQPYDAQVIESDVERLYRLGQFRSIEAAVETAPEGAVVVVYRVVEAPIVADVEVVGNRRISNQEISRVVDLVAGTPVDEYELGRAKRAIEELYRNKGYYLADVDVDEEELEASGIVLFRVREGERIKVTDIRFDGVESFRPKQIRPVLNTKKAGIFERGPLDDEVLDRDVSAILGFYRDRGFLDVRADRLITPSPDNSEAIVTFIVDEGPVYTLRSLSVRNALGADAPPLALETEQVQGLIPVKPGDVYAVRDVQEAVREVETAFSKLGFANVRVRRDELRVPDAERPQVDLLLTIEQGQKFRTGEVIIQGNELTQQRVIRREIEVRPDRPLDAAAVQDSEARLANSRLFANDPPPRITIQPEDPAFPGYRDVLVQVEEANTGEVNFGVQVGSDAGVSGGIILNQRNFDLYDTPQSFEEFITGRAFRGAGQNFSIAIQPGTEVSTYSVSLTEPRLFDSDYSVSGTGFYRDREYDEYDEKRLGGRIGLGRRFGDRWVGGLSLRVENVELDSIVPSAPVDVFQAAGPDVVTGLGFSMTRTSVPVSERFFPTRGTRLELGFEQVGALGGDYSFSKVSAEHKIFLTVFESDLGYKGVLSLNTRAAYIFPDDEAPVYERYYMGGRSFRGFEYRTISPKGIRNDTGTLGNDPVGGDWLFFFGAEYIHPIWRDVLSIATFVDSGTVTNEVGFDDYRVSAGVGIRLRFPALSPVPLAFDFGFPIIDQEGDESEVFSFSLDLPF